MNAGGSVHLNAVRVVTRTETWWRRGIVSVQQNTVDNDMARFHKGGVHHSVKHVALALLVSGAVALLPSLVAADEPPKEWDGVFALHEK